MNEYKYLQYIDPNNDDAITEYYDQQRTRYLNQKRWEYLNQELSPSELFNAYCMYKEDFEDIDNDYL